jgi:phage recombination protein Bet
MADSVRNAVAERNSVAQAPDQDPGGAVLALRDDQTWWSKRQLAALKALGIRNASSEDLLIFLHYCAKTRLDPFSKQIYLLERRAKEGNEWVYRQTIQVGIDGFRVVAQRAAERQGVYIEYEDTVWFDENQVEYKIWLKTTPPAGARVTVLKVLPDGRKLRFPGVVRFTSYAAYSKDGSYLLAQWGVMEDHMIEKCGEAFALRRAFPNDLGGMYAEEELMHEPPPVLQARQRPAQPDDDFVVTPEGNDTAVTPEPPQGGAAAGDEAPQVDEPARKAQLARLHAIFRECHLGAKNQAETRRAVITGLLNPEGHPTEFVQLSSLTNDALSAAITALEQYVAEVGAAADDGTKLTTFADRVTAVVQQAQAAKP